ncbi:hypothetical protein LCGC14_1872930 [marine sediment metagenome]|uniref:Uncharacterized protein n=1 Tax=marine sediment metagenome TaxID=412755 RepID=A0A0F9G4C1_9ZZZZ
MTFDRTTDSLEAITTPKMNTHIVQIGDIWHRRTYGTRITLCGEKVDPDVSPGIVQRVFERLREGKTDERCFDCERVWESGLQPEEFWETHERTGEPLGDRKPVKYRRGWFPRLPKHSTGLEIVLRH